jgi:hypothetical protein
MNKIVNAKLALDLAIENLGKLIALGIDTPEDYDEVHWLQFEFDKLNK